MASEFLIPHPNIPTADIGLPKLKEVTVKNNENFLALDRLAQSFSASLSALDKAKAAASHTHEYAPLDHTHQLTDVEGLIPALEQKAPLVHNYPQYLTEVPEHSHTIYNVNGLVEALADKANAQHAHNMDEVNGLLNALAWKASSSDVDWLFENMAKVEPQDSENVPLLDGYGDDGVANIGSSPNAAREDHQHPINKTGSLDNVKKDGMNEGAGRIGGEDTLAYAMADHSHPLNYPSGKPTEAIAHDGMGDNDGPMFGNTNYYADLGHSHPLNVTTIGTPADVVKANGTASLGSEPTYARTDHVHKMPEIIATDVKYGTNSTVGAKLEDHEGRIDDLESGASGSIKAGDNVSLLTNDANYQNANQVGEKVAEEIGKLDKWPGFGTTHDKAAYGDHLHGNISSDGKMEFHSGVVTVDLDGRINNASDLFLPKLLSVQGSFNYNATTNEVVLGESKWVKTDEDGKLVTISDEDAPASQSSVEGVREIANAAQETATAAATAASVADGKAVAAQDAAVVADGKAEANAQGIAALDGRLGTIEDSVSSLSGTVSGHSATIASHGDELEVHQSALENITNVLLVELDDKIDAAQAKANEAMAEAESKVDENEAGTIADGRIEDWETRFGPVAEDELDSKNTILGYIKDEQGNKHLVASDILDGGKIKDTLIPDSVLTETDVGTVVAAKEHEHSQYATNDDLNSVKTTAETAATDAASAKTIANGAMTVANSADGKADAAIASADAAASTASAAKQRADSAFSKAESAETTANTAYTQAQLAKSEAEQATTDIAGLKSRVSTNETNISSNTSAITEISTTVSVLDIKIADAETDISSLDVRVSAAEDDVVTAQNTANEAKDSADAASSAAAAAQTTATAAAASAATANAEIVKTNAAVATNMANITTHSAELLAQSNRISTIEDDYINSGNIGNHALTPTNYSATLDAVYAKIEELQDYALKSELGNAAYKDVGTGADDVAAGNHTHTGLSLSAQDNDAGFIDDEALEPYAKSADVESTYATKTALSQVETKAEKGIADAATAQTTAESAGLVADAANALAGIAKNVADSATTLANAAQSAADAAQQTADSKITSTQANSLIDTKISALDLPNTYAAKSHEHEVSDITDLSAAYKSAFVDGRHDITKNGIVGFNGTNLVAADQVLSDVVGITATGSTTLDSVIDNTDGKVKLDSLKALTASSFVKTDADGHLAAATGDDVPLTEADKDVADGVAGLDENGCVSEDALPDSVALVNGEIESGNLVKMGDSGLVDSGVKTDEVSIFDNTGIGANATCLVKMNASGLLTRVVDIPSGLTADKMLIAKKDDGGVVWGDAPLPSAPATSKDISHLFSDDIHVDVVLPISDNPIWQQDGTNGYVESSVIATDAVNAARGYHRLWFAKKHYSADGRLLRVDGITAANFIRV